MWLDSLPPRVLKVWGIQAAHISDTVPLIARLRANWPLSVILSAPNTDQFRTTNVLIKAASALANWDIQKSKEILLSVQDFVLNTVCEPLRGEPIFMQIQRDIEELFHQYFASMDFYARDRSPTARFYTTEPEESNDFVASIWRKPVHNGRGGYGKLHTAIPFIELGENISAIMYAHLTSGASIMSRSWMGQEIGAVHQKVRERNDLIISGALRMSPRDKMLALYWRGYTDANAGRLAVGSWSELLVHKEFPVCTADPRIVNGTSRPISEASMATLLATLHPLVGAQFLNPHVFADGEPVDIQVGDFASDRITRVSHRDISEALPLIQKGPPVRRDSLGESFGDISLSAHEWGSECLVSVIDHSPRSQERMREMIWILWQKGIVVSLNERVASVLVPSDQADDTVRQLHREMCEK
jgi:hypothetical protein